MTEVRTISMSEWKKMGHHGYASVRDGQRYILAFDKKSGATVLEPIRVNDSAA